MSLLLGSTLHRTRIQFFNTVYRFDGVCSLPFPGKRQDGGTGTVHRENYFD